MLLCENSVASAPESTAVGMPQVDGSLKAQSTASRPWGAWISLALAMSIAGSAVVAGKLLVGSVPVFLAAEMGLGVGLLVMLPQLWLKREATALDARTHATLPITPNRRPSASA